MTEITEKLYSEDVQRVLVDNKEYFIVGTAHISKQSAELVRKVIENEKPDTVCVELDEQRFKSLSEKKKWEELDIRTVIKQKQLATLMINIMLASYQKKLGEKLGVAPGVELLEATKAANENEIPIELCDRDVRITLKRTWNSMNFWQKMKFLSITVASVFDKEEVSEEQLNELKEKDHLTELMNEIGKAMPVLKRVLIDERDTYLAQKIRKAKGEKIVAVVGAGHSQGIVEQLNENIERPLDDLVKIPPASKVGSIIGWSVPLIILGAIAYIGISQGFSAAGDNFLFWALANGIPSSIGALIALAHPLTVGITFLAAPFTSLTPVIGAGYVAAFVQAYIKPPIVREFQTVSDDINKVSNWWKNKLLRVLLVFIMASLGSVLGTYIGAYEIISNLFN